MLRVGLVVRRRGRAGEVVDPLEPAELGQRPGHVGLDEFEARLRVFHDERGWFFESHNREAVRAALGVEVEFVQDNHSCSALGVVRGLHFQRAPHAQGKLVRVSKGRAFDVAVDIRPGSPRFGRWTAAELSAGNFRQMWIPAGFAHGFQTLADETELSYLISERYDADLARGVRWDDPSLAIAWPSCERRVISERDRTLPLLDR